MLSEAFVLQSSAEFERLLMAADYSLVNPPRLAMLRSRQTIDVDVDIAAVQEIDMYVPEDRTTGETGPFVLTKEPRFENGQNISSSVAYAFMATWFEWGAQQVFLSDPDDVAAIDRILSAGFATMKLTNRTVEGPVTLRGAMNRQAAGNRFTEINASANDALGSDEHPLKYHIFPTPRVVEPQTELAPEITFDGSLFATLGVAAGSDFQLVQNIITLVGDIKG